MALFHGNRSTKPGMASRELVYEAKCVELAGLSNQIITSMRLGSWRPRKMESASPAASVPEIRQRADQPPPAVAGAAAEAAAALAAALTEEHTAQ